MKRDTLKSIAAGLLLLCVPFAAVAFDSSALPGPGPAPAFTAVGGTVTQPVVFTGDNASGTGTVRIRPSDEDTQLVLGEASNNASPEVFSAVQHYNQSTTTGSLIFGSNIYLDNTSAYQRYNTSFGSGYIQTVASSTLSSNGVYWGAYNTSGTIAGYNTTLATGASTVTNTFGVSGTVTNDFRGPITNGGSATCNGVPGGAVCVNDQPVFYDSSAIFAAQFGSSAANSSTQIWEYTQGTAGQATTLFATGTMASPTVIGAVGYYGSTYSDADSADTMAIVGVGKLVQVSRTDDVASGTAAFSVKDNTAATGVLLCDIDGAGRIRPLLYGSQTDCTDNAGAAACGAAPTGAVVLDDGSTTVVVSTTAVTANSTIDVSFDPSLGTKLGITCNTTQTFPYVSARTAGTSFTITSADPAGTNKACFSYSIVN